MNRAKTESPGRFCLGLTLPASHLPRADQVIE
jgi:hypothetical protein